MRIKSVKVGVVSVLVLGLLLGTGPVFAAGPVAGSAAGTPAAPGADWQPLKPGQRLWYAFNYVGDNSRIGITMHSKPVDSATFAVWSPAALQQWLQTGTENPVGRGSDNAAVGGSAGWSGNFGQAGTYYIVVDNWTSAPDAYQVIITGTGVRVPAAAPGTNGAVHKVAPYVTDSENDDKDDLAKAEAAEEAQVPVAETPQEELQDIAEYEQAEAAAAAAAANQVIAPVASPKTAFGGKGLPPVQRPGAVPEMAIAAAANNTGTPLQLHELRWYSFQVTDKNLRIVVRVSGAPANSASFSIWTPGNGRHPVGRGTPNAAYGGDPVWAGSFVDPGTYYIRVEQNGPAPAASYQLQVLQ